MKLYKRITNVYARELTEKDIVEMNGILVSREGPKEVKIGDYAGSDAAGIYKIKREVMLKNYVMVQFPDESGYAVYIVRDPYRWAEKQDQPFETDSLPGKTGDYRVWDYKRTHSWPVAPEIFENSCIEVEAYGK